MATTRVLDCPKCGATLTPPSRFATSVVCAYCKASVQIDPSSVSVDRYRDARRAWERAEPEGPNVWTVADGRWRVGPRVATGENTDVHLAERARWPTEFAVLHVLRDGRPVATIDHAWDALTRLSVSNVDGAGAMVGRIPQPIARGVVAGGAHDGHRAMLVRRGLAFDHTLADVRVAYPSGIDPAVSIWIWRRTLETLAFVHRNGLAHGALRPEHVLVQRGDHGVRIVGWSAAGEPDASRSASRDVRASAECLAIVLGDLARVPPKLAHCVADVARGALVLDAWQLRERVGTIAREVFGPPAFCPLTMPD